VKRRAWIFLTLLGLCGCFAAIRAYRQGSVCTPEAAERAGLSDARAGRPLNERYAGICTPVSESSLNRAYRNAYDRVPASERHRRGLLGRLLGRGGTAPAEPPKSAR
jgi:hypothetical protein